MVKSPIPIHLWHGKNTFALYEELSLWKKRFSEKYNDLNTISFSETDFIDERFIRLLPNSIKGDSLFGSTKFIVLKNILSTKRPAKGVLQTIEDVLTKPSNNTFIVFFQTETITQKKLHNGIKHLEKKGKASIKEFPLPNSKDKLALYALNFAKKNGISIDMQTINILIQKTCDLEKYSAKVDETNIWSVAIELKKLNVYTGNLQITVKDIETLETALHHDAIWELMDAILLGNKKIVAWLLDKRLKSVPLQGHPAELRSLLTLLSKQISMMLAVKRLSGAKLYEYVKNTKISKGKEFMLKKQATHLSEKRLMDLQNKIVTLFTTSVTTPKILKAEVALLLV